MEKQKISIGTFDLAKGVYVVLMLFCHSLGGFNDVLYNGIGNAGYWLPLYIFDRVMRICATSMVCIICGYGFRKKSMKMAVKGQIKYIWKPYLLVALSVAAATAAKKLLLHESVLAGLRFSALPFLFGFFPSGTFLGLEMSCIGPMWFVVMYVVSGIMLNAVLQEDRTWVQICLVLIGACAGVMLGKLLLPFCFQQSLVCTLYMYIGWLMKKKKFFETEIPLYFKMTAIAAVIAASFGGVFDISGNVWEDGMVNVLAGALGGVTLLCLLLRLDRFEGRLAQGLRWLGRNILLLCCIHTAVFLIIPFHRLSDIFAARPILGILIQFVSFFVTGIGGCLAVEKLTQYFRENKQEEPV